MAKKRARRGRGEGSVREESPGRWVAVLSLGTDPMTKKRVRRKFIGRTKREALEKMRAAQLLQDRGSFPVDGKLTVGEWLTQWLELKKARVEPGTWGWYEKKVRVHLIPTIGQKPLGKLTPLDIERMHSTLSANEVSAAQQAKIATTLRTALKDAMKRKLIHTNPALEVDKPLVVRTEQPCMSREQAQAFLEAAKGIRLESLFRLALDSGMRPGEILGLHWPELDLDRGSVLVCRSLEEIGSSFRIKRPKTAKSRRTILIGRATVESLHRHRERMEQEGRDVEAGPVFVSIKGTWIGQSNLNNKIFQKVLRKAGLPKFRPYTLRHTSATLLLERNVNIRVVSERLGHESIEITLKHYVHAIPSLQAQAVEAVNELFG